VLRKNKESEIKEVQMQKRPLVVGGCLEDIDQLLTVSKVAMRFPDNPSNGQGAWSFHT
jgi:hypothetical protein